MWGFVVQYTLVFNLHKGQQISICPRKAFMNIRHAALKDIPALLAVYDRARSFMAANGNPTQWPANYIHQGLLENDIAQHTLYVCEDADGIQGVFMYAEGPDPTYLHIENGSWPSDTAYAVVHRVASAGKVKGVLSHIIAWASAQSAVLRMDTHADNAPMQHLLEKLGFQRCGIIYVEDGTPRIAYQKG